MPETYAVTLQETGGVPMPDRRQISGMGTASPYLQYAVDTAHIMESLLDTEPRVGSSNGGSFLSLLPRTLGELVAPAELILRMNFLADFHRWAAAWKRDTGHLSIEGEIASHEAYQNIIAMGAPAIPLILEDLITEPDFWFIALHEITGDFPEFQEEDEGNIDALSRAWIEWGKIRGYTD